MLIPDSIPIPAYKLDSWKKEQVSLTGTAYRALQINTTELLGHSPEKLCLDVCFLMQVASWTEETSARNVCPLDDGRPHQDAKN